jgi:hypothetical protein
MSEKIKIKCSENVSGSSIRITRVLCNTLVPVPADLPLHPRFNLDRTMLQAVISIICLTKTPPISGGPPPQPTPSSNWREVRDHQHSGTTPDNGAVHQHHLQDKQTHQDVVSEGMQQCPRLLLTPHSGSVVLQWDNQFYLHTLINI